MNKTHLYNILNQYIERYDEFDDDSPTGNDEGYKWRVVREFKKHWDIDAEDFASMFKKAFEEVQKSNLIDNKTVQPIGGITLLLKYDDEVEFVRECFKELFSDDNGDIDLRQERIETFIDKINLHIDKYVKGSWKYPQQRNNVIYYLNLWKPEENYIFKSTEATEWANCIEFGDDFGSGESFSLKKYYKMCDELLAELKNNDEIMHLYGIRKKEKAKNFDDDGHILVYDIIYCAKAYNLYKNVPTLRKISTKQRIYLAETAEKREHLLESLSELSVEFERLSIAMELPNISGETVYHKKWGSGTVVTCQEGFVEVEFAEGSKKLQYPHSINKFLELNTNEYNGIFEEYLQNEQEKNSVEAALKKVTRELEELEKLD